MADTTSVNNDNKNENQTSERNYPCSPDLPGNVKQSERQIKPRTLSYSGDLMSEIEIDESKVEKIHAREQGFTFNIQELICSILKDDSFIDKLAPKICDSVFERLDKKYASLFNDVVKPLQNKVEEQAAKIQWQKGTIDKHVKKLVDHEITINAHERTIKSQEQTITEMREHVTALQQQMYDLDWRLEEQEQYSRRTSLRFHNIP